MASSVSCVITLTIPSAPPTPAAGLLGPVVWISQPLGHWSTLPIKAHLMSAPPIVAWCGIRSTGVQNPSSL